jgi:hypothetical protein
MKPDAISSLVLFAVAPGDFIALSQDQLQQARALARHIVPPAGAAAPQLALQEPLLSADQMEERTMIPASWFLEQARRDAIPHVRLGKYVRFRLSEVHAAGSRGQKAR